ncbi:hypothetical protein D8674_040217 [Pyrus ussuriensis x Pyrus communis]|uniref:RNase H type-1 domain-containing protein n=1 Tax=Pyrus ussuriensis x Pyrus communis TaxID=2448454 RepID=A0A5N5I2L3_9ROSA|nr:hypothetical protein D8674_040217 [Pyrus ussuriensis x Pyrus communis]
MNAWRICKDIVPTKSNLVKRRITFDFLSVLCGSVGELGVHILCDYPFATCVWSFSPLGRLPCGPSFSSACNCDPLTSWFLTPSPGGKTSNLPPLLLQLLFFPHVPSLLFAQALAVREGKVLPRRLPGGFHNIVIENDSLQITQSLRSSSSDLSPISLNIEDSRELSMGITGVCFTHIKHQANEVAHRLARFSLSSSSPSMGFEEPTDFILDVLFANCNSEQ